MLRILEKLKKRLCSKGASHPPLPPPPPPYEENEANNLSTDEGIFAQNEAICHPLDLLASCKIDGAEDGVNKTETSREVFPSEVMGIKHSTPWGSRHRSKISLTWVLREQNDVRNFPSQDKRLFYEDFRINSLNNTNNTHTNDSSRRRDGDAVLHSRSVGSRNVAQVNSRTMTGDRAEQIKGARIVGRNALYNSEPQYKDFKVRDVSGAVESSSDGASAEVSVSERGRRKKRRRRKRDADFGYEINNIDGFLAEASIDRPGNIPVVLTCASTLYRTSTGAQHETTLPLGTVLNAVFKKCAWLYVQTPHAEEGYVQHAACLPLGILPPDKRGSPRHKTPCWESSTDVYPRPCGNMTDAQKEGLCRRTRSECGRRDPLRRRGPAAAAAPARSLCGEEAFDSLYLKATSACELDRAGSEKESRRWKHDMYEPEPAVSRHTLVVMREDSCNSTSGGGGGGEAAVRRGEVVALLQRGAGGGGAGEWYRTRKEGYGYI